MPHILVVEDNIVTNKAISSILRNQGYEVSSVFSAEDALEVFKPDKYDLLIIDLYLPKMSGYTFLQAVRKRSIVPVIINTSYASVKSRVKLINIGANDFIDKSHGRQEILDSIHLLLNDESLQKKPQSKMQYTIDHLEIDFASNRVLKEGQLVELTMKELSILKLLFDNPNEIFSRKQMCELIWGEKYDASFNNTINVHMKRLRNKIEENPNQPKIIETVWKQGHRLGIEIADKIKSEDEYK